MPTEKTGDSVIPQVHFKKAQGSGFFYIKGKGNGRDKSLLRTTDIWAPAGVRGRSQNYFVLSPLTLVDVNPFIRFLRISDKQSLFLYILLLSPWERHLLVRNIFPKTQATSKIPLYANISICKKLFTWRLWERSRLE